MEVGLRGYGADGMPSAGWAGRLADRNSAFADLLFSSGIRLTEGASLLTLEVPRLRLEGGRYYVGRLARVVTKSKRARTFYASSVVVGEIEAYGLTRRAHHLRSLADRHNHDRINSQEPTA